MKLLHPIPLYRQENQQNLPYVSYQRVLLILCLLLLHSFTVAQIYQAYTIPALNPVGHSATAWADFNNDGYLDFIITGQKSNGDHITELFKNNVNSTNPTFTLYSSFTPVAYGSVIWGDVNNDTYLDFHLAGQTSTGHFISELYINQGNETFTLHPVSLEGVAYSAATFTDFDHDGSLDLVYTGVNNKNESVCKFYKNQQGAFTEVVTSLSGFAHGSLEAADYNHDGYVDLLITGLLGDGSKASHIYRNEGNLNFTKINTTLPPIAFGDASWGDYNQDGYPDVLLSGIGEGGAFMSKVYKNNKNEVFTEVPANLIALSNSSVVWLDYNNDGALDIFITGLANSNAANALYENNGGDSFSLVNNVGISKVYDGDISITDHDLDGNLDLLITGFNNMGVQSKLYTNTLTSTNNAPAVPTGLYTITGEDSAILHWRPATDPETSIEGISYEVYIGTSPQEGDIISPHAITASGQRKVLKIGSQSFLTSYTIKDLPEGRYFWAVQGVDASLMASSFSAVDSFDICYSIDLGEDKNICSGETVSLALDKNFDQVSWHSAKGIKIDSQATISLTFYEADTVWVIAKNQLGCLLQDTVIVHVEPLPTVNLGRDTILCYQEALTLLAKDLSDSINWYSRQYGLLATDTTQFTYQALFPDTLWIEAFNTYGCVNYDTLIIGLHDQPIAEAGKDRTVCLGSMTVLGGGSRQQGNLQYQWSPAYGLDHPTAPNPIASPDTTTTYILQVVSSYGCTSFDSVVVMVYAPVILHPGQDTTICKGESVMLGEPAMMHSSSFTPSYEWFPKTSLDNAQAPQPIATPDSTTTYTLIVKTGDCAVDTAQITVHVSNFPEVKANPDMTIGFGETIQLKAEGGVQYHWFPSDGLSRSDVAEPFAAPKSTTTYVVTGYNQYGCSKQDSVTIYVDNRIFIPNLFSPNQDGQNDTFKVYGAGIETLTLLIYDALGKQVYSSTDVQGIMETGWDGTFHGSPLASGHYLWVIQGRFYDGKAVMFEGKISGKIRLIR